MADLRRVQKNGLNPGRNLQRRELSSIPPCPSYELTDQFPKEAPQLAWSPDRTSASLILALPQPRGWSRGRGNRRTEKELKESLAHFARRKSIFGSKTRTKCCCANFHKDGENVGSHRSEATSHQSLPRETDHHAYLHL